MVCPDVNVLVYANRLDSEDHERYRDWLLEVANGDEAYGLSDLVLSGFLRIVTHPRIFNQPTSLVDALAFADALRSRPNRVVLAPGPRHWGIFADLCRRADVRGNRVPDAYFAALAIETGSEWITADHGFSRFPGLRWRHPLQDRR